MVFKFIDLFAGIGGFHIAMHNAGAKCVFASEIDRFARITYEHNMKKISPDLFENNKFNDDILKIDPSDIPDHEILCAGFPCQPFSQAGYKRGFNESKQDRGNMFFVIRDIIKEKRPKAIFLENVRHLEKHDDGKTFAIIKEILEKELNYDISYKIVKASDYGLPQHRPRIFIVGFRKEDNYSYAFQFPPKRDLLFTMSDVLGGFCNKEIGFTLRVGGRSSPIDDRRNWDSYLVDNKVYKIYSKDGKKMMGLPDDFEFPVSETQAMKQLGNSVAVTAVEAVSKEIIRHLNNEKRNLSLEINQEKLVMQLV